MEVVQQLTVLVQELQLPQSGEQPQEQSDDDSQDTSSDQQAETAAAPKLVEREPAQQAVQQCGGS